MRAITCIKEYWQTPRRPLEILIDAAFAGFFVVGLFYLLFKTYQVSSVATYDFKYIWLAGKLWLQGVNPYTAEYAEFARQNINQGHVPSMWVYPPNFYIPAILSGLTPVNLSSILWNVAGVVMIIASSALLTAAALPISIKTLPDTGFLRLVRKRLTSPLNLFFIHLGLMATLQATAITLSVGQTSILIYFGVSLLLYGLKKNFKWTSGIGLAITFLKPQIGAIVLIVILLHKTNWMMFVRAAIVSAAISLPAFIQSPLVIFDWLRNVHRYDGYAVANMPQSTTGLRNVFWDLFSSDIGNMTSMIASLIVIGGLCITLKYLRRGMEAQSEAQHTAKMIIISSIAILALAPLHIYDFVLFGIVLLTLMTMSGMNLIFTGIGAFLLWRADDIAAMTGFYAHGTEHFEGTRLATLGAIIVSYALVRWVLKNKAI